MRRDELDRRFARRSRDAVVRDGDAGLQARTSQQSLDGRGRRLTADPEERSSNPPEEVACVHRRRHPSGDVHP
jgi:hypothetical protein